MKRITIPPIRALGILMMFLLSLQLKAQTAHNPVLTWDKEVGCIEYDDRGEKDHYDLYEQIAEGKCLRFCEQTTVTYTFNANDVAQVSWQATGGNVQSSSTTNAVVQWGAAGNGSLTLTVTYGDNTVEVLTICVEKIPSPIARFLVDGINPGQTDFCANMPISFDNLSTENNGTAIVNYLWDFGDGTTSALFEPTHTYSNPGTYPVTLTVTNACNCSSVHRIVFNITPAPAFEISCASVACEGSVQHYSVNDPCGGQWQVQGGHVVGNSPNTVDVVWDQVNPMDGFGYVSYRSNCSCPFWTTVKIPVILHKGIIQGPGVVCEGGQGRFTMPQWPTTEFDWMIDGNPYDPMLVHTDQRNEIVVDGLVPGMHTLTVAYRNTLIDGGHCEGKAEVQFEVAPKTEIVTDDALTVCKGTPKDFHTANGAIVDWSIMFNGTEVASASAPNITYTFNQGGTYVITADNKGCLSDPVTVEVIEKPVLTGTISGPAKVCLNTPYTYTISENEPGAIYVWSLSAGSGSVIGNNAGTQADFKFSSATATVSVVKQYVKNGVICESDPVTFNVSQLQVTPTIVNNSGLVQFCPSNIYTFTANTNGIDVDLIEWELQPSNFGNIIDGANAGTVTVSLNEESNNTSSGTLILTVTKCNKKISYSFTIHLLSNLSMTIDDISNICPSEPFDVPLSFAPTGIGGGTLEFYYNGANMYATPFNGNMSYTIPQNFTPSTTGSITGDLTVKWVDPNGCSAVITKTKQVTVLPLTTVEVFNSGSGLICPSNTYHEELEATFSTGVTASSDFIWHYENSPIPGTNVSHTPVLTLTDTNGVFQGAGYYYVKVKDVNDCWITSNKIYLRDDCGTVVPGGPGSGCGMSFDPFPTLTYSWSDCNTVNITAAYHTALTNIVSYEWDAITPGAVLGTNSNIAAAFSMNDVGVYKLRVKVRYNGCPDTFTQVVEVRKHYEPILRYSVSCEGGNLYTVKLMNNSKMFDIDENEVTLEYLNGSSVIGTDVQEVLLTGVPAGTYTYKLRLSTGETTTNGTAIQDCETTVTITLDPPPALNFTIPTGATVCANEPVTLRLPGGTFNSNYTYEWFFKGTSYRASGAETEISFSENYQGSQNVSLKITNQYDCEFTSAQQQVTVNIANFNVGTILPLNPDYCEGNAVPLTYSGLQTPGDIIWMRDNVEVATGLSYQPTQSGSYWPVLVDANTNCKSYIMADKAVSYELRKPPFASISGNTSVCFGEDTTLTGIYTDDTAEHRWIGPGVSGSYGNWVSGTANLNLDVSGLAPGSYDYTFETRVANDPSCTGSFTVTVVFHPQVTTPIVNAVIAVCEPFTVELTVTNPQSGGTYNWSNGMTGTVIQVTHGGAYSVTYTAPTGCTATGYIQAPHNPERALWVVPSGCYNVCLNNGLYLLGPLGMYDGYEWLVNGSTSQSGSGFIPNQPINAGGSYQLNIDVAMCSFGSNELFITPDLNNCPNVPPCKINGAVRQLTPAANGSYLLSLYLVNPNTTPVTVSLSSLNGYGTYSPATVTLNPGANTIYPLYFYPNATFIPGAPDGIVVQMGGCTDVINVRYTPNFAAKNGETVEPTLELSPNPATETTTAVFNVGTDYQNAQSIAVYDVMGVQRLQQSVSGAKGEVLLNVSRLAPGTYLVNLQADGVNIAQQKLIKK